MLQRRETARGGDRLIEQIQRPSLLIRLISLLPEVNYHTHTSCCCSTYIIITVARMENDPKLAIWGLHHRPATQAVNIYFYGPPSDCFTTTTPSSIFSTQPSWHAPEFPPPRVCASRMDWFHLFNDGCANDPSHVADDVIDTRTCQEWGLDGDWMGTWSVRGGCYWKGQDEVCVCVCVNGRSIGLCLSQTNKDTGCRMEIENHSMEKLLHHGTDEKRPLHLSSQRDGC